jgi:hypothetical protein
MVENENENENGKETTNMRLRIGLQHGRSRFVA